MNETADHRGSGRLTSHIDWGTATIAYRGTGRVTPEEQTETAHRGSGRVDDETKEAEDVAYRGSGRISPEAVNDSDFA